MKSYKCLYTRIDEARLFLSHNIFSSRRAVSKNNAAKLAVGHDLNARKTIRESFKRAIVEAVIRQRERISEEKKKIKIGTTVGCG